MLGVGALKQNLTWAGVDKEIRYSAAVTETRIQSGGTGSVSGGAGCYDLASAHERERGKELLKVWCLTAAVGLFLGIQSIALLLL